MPYQKPPKGRPIQLNVYVSEEMFVDILTINRLQTSKKGYTSAALDILTGGIEEFKLKLPMGQMHRFKILREAIEAEFRIRRQRLADHRRERETEEITMVQRMRQQW